MDTSLASPNDAFNLKSTNSTSFVSGITNLTAKSDPHIAMQAINEILDLFGFYFIIHECLVLKVI
jgi:hypothetical protein